MPQANVWIKKENWDKWQGLEDKGKFVNDALSETLQPSVTVIGDNARIHVDNRLRNLQKKKGVEFCKHNQVKGFCKLGCK